MSDVLVLGAGPAGATTAALLAREGVSVRVLEAATFPRFHIGESLLPCDLPVFERLGFAPDHARYVHKAGAEFLDERSGGHSVFLFADGLPGTPGHAWQVERARFDDEVARIAIDAGAEIRFDTRVADVTLGEDGVSAVDARGERHDARYLVDASGQDAFLARRLRARRNIEGFGAVAAFTHFEGLADDVQEELLRQGNILVFILEDGWAWAIPLVGGRLSVGRVTRSGAEREAPLEALLESSPRLRRLTEGARRGPTRLHRNFAYANLASYGPRYACVGDAACFLDPVFSSGVSLAMVGGAALADALAPALARDEEGAPDLMAPLSAQMRYAYESFGSLVHSFYNTRLVEHFFFHPEPEPDLRAGLITLLAGDVFRDDNRFQKGLLNGRRRWHLPSAEVP